MESLIIFLSFIFLGYLLGAIPFGKIIGNIRHIDIQKEGSGNIGFANAVRVLGWKPALIILTGDILKGYVPVHFAQHELTMTALFMVASAAIIGHVFPVWLKFRGGKGVATALGVTLALQPLLAMSGVAIYVLVISLVRKSAVASLTGAWCLPLFCLLIAPVYAFYYLLIAGFITFTHRANIKQMIKFKSLRV
jgi:acyl phosphate:glycerol-3-phosphate acyltransferase